MFSPAPAFGEYPQVSTRSYHVRATGGAGSSCCMYWKYAMWRDFQSAAFVSVGESLSGPRPLAARFWFTRLSTAWTRSWRGVPQFDRGVQSPTMAACASGAARGCPPGPPTAYEGPVGSGQGKRPLLAFSIRSFLLASSSPTTGRG